MPGTRNHRDQRAVFSGALGQGSVGSLHLKSCVLLTSPTLSFS